MRNAAEIRERIKQAAERVRQEHPLAPSITNAVTMEFVANAQLAVGGSAAMVYLADEGEAMAEAAGAMYLNMGTILPLYETSMPRTVQCLAGQHKSWVLDPVGIGIGGLREKLLRSFRQEKPGIIRGNASELIALARLWKLDAGTAETAVCGVDTTQSVAEARQAARSLARWTGGAVAVSGKEDLVTDGETVFLSAGGSPLMTKITGAGCSLGGVMAVYACCAEPFIAAAASVALYNLAGERAEKDAPGPGSFRQQFIDELYLATPEEIAGWPFKLDT